MTLPTRVNRALAYDPSETVRDWEIALNRFLGRECGAALAAPFTVDVREDADHLYVVADLPGFTKEEVDITFENSTLTITGEKHPEKSPGGAPQGEYLLQERRYTRYQRSFTLPPTVNGQNVDAKLEEGVLTITLNKREETKPRKIAVK